MDGPKDTPAAYIATKCLELLDMARNDDLKYLAQLLEAACLEARLATFDLETVVKDDPLRSGKLNAPGER